MVSADGETTGGETTVHVVGQTDWLLYAYGFLGFFLGGGGGRDLECLFLFFGDVES